jgi:hypothetical protein
MVETTALGCCREAFMMSTARHFSLTALEARAGTVDAALPEAL